MILASGYRVGKEISTEVLLYIFTYVAYSESTTRTSISSQLIIIISSIMLKSILLSVAELPLHLQSQLLSLRTAPRNHTPAC